MFGRIAPRYDLLNHLLSGGLDILWRRKAARLLAPRPGERLLDLCSGTGDLALAIAGQAGGAVRLTAADFTFEMLALGRRKFEGKARIPEAGADGLCLPFGSGTFDGVTAAFGVRNFEDHRKGFREIFRVLRPGGRLVVLEFTPEPTGFLSPLVRLHLRHVLPRLGKLLSGDAAAYRYLPNTIERWPDPVELAGRLREAGFREVAIAPLSFGVAAIHVARKA